METLRGTNILRRNKGYWTPILPALISTDHKYLKKLSTSNGTVYDINANVLSLVTYDHTPVGNAKLGNDYVNHVITEIDCISVFLIDGTRITVWQNSLNDKAIVRTFAYYFCSHSIHLLLDTNLSFR